MQYNPISIITLYKKEVQRFTKIPLQTIVAPAATSLLFMVIFTTAIGSVRTNYPLDSFKSFLFPGLIMMTIIQNAFMNNSSSIFFVEFFINVVITISEKIKLIVRIFFIIQVQDFQFLLNL